MRGDSKEVTPLQRVLTNMSLSLPSRSGGRFYLRLSAWSAGRYGSLGLEAPAIPCPLPRLQLEWLGAWPSGNGHHAKLHFDQVEGGHLVVVGDSDPAPETRHGHGILYVKVAAGTL